MVISSFTFSKSGDPTWSTTRTIENSFNLDLETDSIETGVTEISDWWSANSMEVEAAPSPIRPIFTV